MKLEQKINEAIKHLKNGDVIAYPTEAVFGLGCDPRNNDAINKLRKIKNRGDNKGFIVIACKFEQVKPFVGEIDSTILEKCLASWPGPITWLLPAKKAAIHKITGDNDTIAVRITNHPVARLLCEKFNGAIISTSANLKDQPPIKTYDEVERIFGDKIDYVLKAEVGTLDKPTQIWNAITGERIR